MIVNWEDKYVQMMLNRSVKFRKDKWAEVILPHDNRLIEIAGKNGGYEVRWDTIRYK